MSIRQTKATIEKITPLTDSILQIILKPDHFIDYQAGQYLQILFEEETLSYSIANAPLGSRNYELHIRHSLDNPCTQALLAEIKQKGNVTIRLPFGDCDLSHLDQLKPIIFIAGGTGFAPIQAMIEQLLADGAPRPFELYWGARSKNDLYMDKQVMEWQAHVSHFQYVSLLSEQSTESLASIVLARHSHDIHHWQVVLSGPFNMVYSTRDALVAQGILRERLFSDAFSFESNEGA